MFNGAHAHLLGQALERAAWLSLAHWLAPSFLSLTMFIYRRFFADNALKPNAAPSLSLQKRAKSKSRHFGQTAVRQRAFTATADGPTEPLPALEDGTRNSREQFRQDRRFGAGHGRASGSTLGVAMGASITATLGTWRGGRRTGRRARDLSGRSRASTQYRDANLTRRRRCTCRRERVLQRGRVRVGPLVRRSGLRRRARGGCAGQRAAQAAGTINPHRDQ